VKNFVVTGAGGFIGRRLCTALRAHGRVVALVRERDARGPWDDVIAADLARDDIAAGAFDGASVVFHCAGKAHAVAERHADAGEYRRVNVEGTRRVLEAAARAGVARFVFASSVKAMGEGDGGGEPSTPYGRSKREAEALVLHGGYVGEPVVLRLALVYGPGVGGNLGGMLRAVRSRRFPPPPRVDNRRSMVHVDDVVLVAIAAGRRPEAVGRAIVVGDGVPYSTHGIYAAMLRSLGRPVPRRSLPAPAWRALARAGDVAGALLRRRAPFDTDAYRKLFASAWYPPTDLEAVLGVAARRTLDDALGATVREAPPAR
jgi:nucleoside-diphosphate-sugar epimerase